MNAIYFLKTDKLAVLLICPNFSSKYSNQPAWSLATCWEIERLGWLIGCIFGIRLLQEHAAPNISGKTMSMEIMHKQTKNQEKNWKYFSAVGFCVHVKYLNVKWVIWWDLSLKYWKVQEKYYPRRGMAEVPRGPFW